jgi:hypothetical protein
LKENTAANQATLLTLIVNTAVIGNYTEPNVGVSVAGILAEGEVNGVKVNLLPYFSGEFASTNAGGMAGRQVNFLDGGGAAPLKEGKPANSEDSRQYQLLTHLYQYFGALLGCTLQGNEAFPAYSGDESQYQVHKFMALDISEVTYFIQQVGLSAKSFGVADDDLTIVGGALMSTFGYRCAPAATVIPVQGPQLQSICIDESCPLSPNATCDSYEAVVKPEGHDNTTASSSGTAGPTSTSGSGSGSATPSTTGPAVVTANVAAVAGLSFAAAFGGLAAMFL